jgi:2-phospho-L-lactate guanylyltransferase
MPHVPDDTAVVIPLRSFSNAKARLAAALDEDARALLARAMAEVVVRAAGTRTVLIVTSAPEVVAWADETGLARIDDPGSLDGAAAAGRAWARERGMTRCVIAHGDLPLATTLDAVAGDGTSPVVVVVPDHRDDGNPVLSLPVNGAFTFSYGPGSAASHAAEARRRGFEVRIVRDHALSFDVDVPADLVQLPTVPHAAP